MACEIELTKGAIALIDDGDFERVSRHSWALDSSGYAVRKVTLAKGKYRKQLLHRFIMGEPKGCDVEHRNGDKLNCQRHNLRTATRSQNCANRGPKPNSRSQYKGVFYKRGRRKPYAEICVNGKQIYLGSHDTEEQAAKAYDAAALEHFGEYAFLNFAPKGRIQNGVTHGD